MIETPSSDTAKLCRLWLNGEYTHSREKFGFNQADDLTRVGVRGRFGPDAESYWGRMQHYEDVDGSMHRAQLAAKMANSPRMLWTTLRAMEWEDNRPAAIHSSLLMEESLANGFADAKRYIDTPDFYDTPVGLGLAWLDRSIVTNGLDRKFRLGQLVRAEQIMYDAVAIMALQFERTLEITGTLPQPGLSSGNVEPWSDIPRMLEQSSIG